MAKILTNSEKKRRMLYKMCKSLENKLHGENIIWWNALSNEAKHSFLFNWILYKNSIKNLNKTPKFKHFLKEKKKRYKVSISNVRNAKIEHIFQL